ncbi:MAG: DUF5329 family protein [Phycisphaerales bacterium]
MRTTLAVTACATLLLGCCNKPDPAPQPAPAKADEKQAAGVTAPVAAKPAETTAAATVIALTEREKIDKLIDALAASSDTFNRNGTDYPAKDAAAHMRSKLSAAGDRVKTVRQFIDGIGSTSSMSGKPYTVKKADGTTINAKEWWEGQLAVIEKNAK